MPSLLNAFRRYAASPLAVSIAALAVANAASGQQDDVIFDHHTVNPKLIFTDADVYFIGASTVLSEGKTEVVPDPRGRYALIECTDMDLPTFLNAPAFPPTSPEKALERGVGASLLLYDSRTNRTKLLWQHRAHPGEAGSIFNVSWLNGKDVALVSVGIERPKTGADLMRLSPDSEFSLLEVHPEAASGASPRVLFRSNHPISTNTSPQLPIALVEEQNEEIDFHGLPILVPRYRALSATGVVSPLLPLGQYATGGYFWNAEGNVAYLMERVPTNPKMALKPTAPPPGEGNATPADPWRRQWYALNMKSGQLTPLDKRPVMPPRSDEKNATPLPVRLASEPVAATLTPPPAPPTVGGAPSTVPTAHIAAKVWPLWLQRRSRPVAKEHRPSAALIAGDADSATLLPDASAILYVADGALHAVPLTHQPRADVEGPYRRYLQQVTMSNAKQIGLAMLQYSQDYDEMLPPAADVAKNVYPYLKNSDVFNNPETDQPAFQYLMDGNPQAKIDSPATTVMGYLTGPDGRAALYADGHVRWEAYSVEK